MIQTTIRVYHPESSHGFKGVHVEISYDDQPGRSETRLAQGRTNHTGIVTLTFSESRLPFPARGLPRFIPIVIRLRSRSGNRDYSINRSLMLDHAKINISIPLTLEHASQLGYFQQKPSRTPDEKVKDWCHEWTNRIKKSQNQDNLDGLCFAQLVLDTLACVIDPETKLQRDVTKRLSNQLSGAQLQEVANYATKAQEMMLDCKLPGLDDCASGSSVEDFVHRVFLTPGGSGYSLYEALTIKAPDPEASLGTPAKGPGFPIPFKEWNKICETRYHNQTLTGQAQADMDQYYPDQLRVLAQPSVNRIEVWDPKLQIITRIGHTPTKELEVQGLDVREAEMRSNIVPMDIDLDDEQCLILEDDGNGKQVLAVDVQPDQKITLMGSGFVSAKATLQADIREWTVLSDGRLQPRNAILPLPGFNNITLDVHGSSTAPLPGEAPETSLNDMIVFTWPQAAGREGLYRVTLTFQNESGYFSSAIQDPATCNLSLGTEDVKTQVLYFAVLPPVTARRVRAVASRVECIDETEPENFGFINYADDISYTADAQVIRVIYDPATHEIRDEPLPDPTPKIGRHLFWRDGSNWSPGLQPFPAIDGTSQFLQLNELVFVLLKASEVDLEHDQNIARLLSIAIMVVIIVIIVAILLILVAAGVASAGVVEVFLGPVALAVIGILLKPETIDLLARTLVPPGEEPLISTLPRFSGQDIAHRLSSIRFHHILFTGERPFAGHQISSTVEDGAIHEIFRVRALGGKYRFHLRLETS